MNHGLFPGVHCSLYRTTQAYSFIALHFIVLHRCCVFYKWKAKPSTIKKIATLFITVFEQTRNNSEVCLYKQISTSIGEEVKARYKWICSCIFATGFWMLFLKIFRKSQIYINFTWVIMGTKWPLEIIHRYIVLISLWSIQSIQNNDQIQNNEIKVKLANIISTVEYSMYYKYGA